MVNLMGNSGNTWVEYLEKEYAKRAPERNPFLTLTSVEEVGGHDVEPLSDPMSQEMAVDDAMEVDKNQHVTEDVSIMARRLVNKHDTRDFYRLPLETRVLVLHDICEWQLDDPERFRRSVKSEEECIDWASLGITV
jgi:hypothetical protein